MSSPRMTSHRCTASILKQTSSTPGQERVIISNASVDRDGDTIDPRGADIEAFAQNGPILFTHRSDELPVGQADRVWLDSSGNLRMEWHWLENDPFADRVKNAWQQGILRGASIGFLPKDSRPNKSGGWHFSEWELLEVSLCAVPSNRSAVAQLKSLGLWGEPQKSWGHDEPIDVPDEWLRDIHRIMRGIIEEELGGRSGSENFDFDPRWLREVVPQVFAEGIGLAVNEEIMRTLNRLRGRVD